MANSWVVAEGFSLKILTLTAFDAGQEVPLPAMSQLWSGVQPGFEYTMENLIATMETKRDRKAWLRGGTVQCEPLPLPKEFPRRLVLLGAPGVGKGTQAELLCANLGACHLSTGDIFRTAKALDASERTPALTAALDYMRRGDLVPDETVLALVTERVGCLRCQGGFLLDGFPRTVAQAEALENLLAGENLKLDAVLSYDLPLEQVVSRLSGRRTCPNCKAVFHIEARPPKVAGVCDHCGGKLYQREDDRPDSIRVRMEAYERSTAPLTDFYRRRRLLLSIPAEGSPEDIFKRSLDALKAAKQPSIIEEPWRDGRLTSNLHWEGYGKDHKSAGIKFSRPGVMEGWHTFSLLWLPTEYVFYVDGEETWRTSASGVSQVPEHIKLTEEIGSWGGKIQKANLPDCCEVDYVRVYEAKAAQAN